MRTQPFHMSGRGGAGDTARGRGAGQSRDVMQRMSAVPRRDAADESETDRPSQHADVLQVLQGLDEWKSEMIREMRNGFDKVLKGIEELRSSRPTTPSSRSFGSAARKAAAYQYEVDTRKRVIPDAEEVTDLNLVAVKDDAWLPAMQMVML